MQIQQQNPNNERRSNIGKPKGMNTQKALDKTNAWSSDQQSTQAVQALSRLGRFICFQQTGKKKIKQDQNTETIDKNHQKKKQGKLIGKSKKIQKQTQDAPGIFLNSDQIQIVKMIRDYCQINERSNKTIFFFRSSYPEFQIINGVPVLQKNFDIYEVYPPLRKLAPLLDQKFLSEYLTYLQFKDGQLEYIQSIQQLYSDFNNHSLKSAETILQCLFTKYLIKFEENIDLVGRKNYEEKLQNLYQQFYHEEQTKKDYEECINELLACMQVEEDYDQQYAEV